MDLRPFIVTMSVIDYDTSAVKNEAWELTVIQNGTIRKAQTLFYFVRDQINELDPKYLDPPIQIVHIFRSSD